MSRARHKEHKMRASGGGLSSEPKWNAGEEQNAAKEAEERKRGGKLKAEGEESKKRMDRKERKRGGVLNKPLTGAMSRKEPMGDKEKSNPEELNRGGAARGRARGGGIGADRTPLTTAAKIKLVTKGEDGEDEVKSD